METVPVTVDCASLQEIDVAVIDRLACIALIAKVSGAEVTLVNVGAELRGLIELCGLADALGVEAQGEPEEREESLGVEKERDVLDPPV